MLPELRQWALKLGFSQIGVADIDLSAAEPGLRAWLAAGFNADMAYMAAHGNKRSRPAELVPGTVSVITARMDYLPQNTRPDWQDRELKRLLEPGEAVISVYARGRDYHKVLRNRLQALAARLSNHVGPLGYRVFTDSAPVLEVELASRSGLGWRGKHTLTLHRDAGSMFFLGEIFVDTSLPATEPVTAHCGTCTACIAACPTGAIVAPYRLDARRCISYLTIEHDGPIPLALREAIGNRIYGCDDCQLVCPWNRYAQPTEVADFAVRHGLDSANLLALWAWTARDFDTRFEGTAIRRIGWQRWRRNLAVAMGNALRQQADPGRMDPLAAALRAALPQADDLVAEHIRWALAAA